MCPEDPERYTSDSSSPAPSSARGQDSDRERRSSTAGGDRVAEGRDGPRIDEADLVERFRSRLRLFALRRLADSARAEDVAQEVLRRVLEAVRDDRLRNPEALPAFVFQTARHVCAHRVRDADRTRRAMRRLAADTRMRPRAGDPLTDLVDSERRARVRDGLRELSDSDRRLLRMLFYEERDVREAARELEITPGALRVRKHRALRRLAEILERRPDDLKRSRSEGHS